MYPTPELIRLIQREREARIRQDRLAAVAACVRACCSTSLSARLARALRLASTTC